MGEHRSPTVVYVTLSNITHVSFRYKAAGANATDEYGNLDLVEFINVAKDDALSWPKRTHRAYPPTVNERMESTIAPFVRKSVGVNNTLLAVFNQKLGLPEGALAKRHTLEEHSGSEARTIKKPGITSDGGAEPGAAIGGHTDFGSLVSISMVMAYKELTLLIVLPA